MEELYKLKEMLCDELKEYGEKGELTGGSLEVVDKLSHAIKNIDKIIENYDGEYSGRMYRGRSYRGSYARKRDRMGRYSGEYSRHDLAEELRGLMEEAPDEQTRKEMERLVEKMEMR